MRAVDLIDRLLNVCGHVFHVLANVCLALMLAINVINISSRAIFDEGLPWVFPWSGVLFVWTVFFGFYVIYRSRRDVTVDFLVERIGPWARSASRFLVNFVVLIVMAVMLWHAPQVLADQTGVIQLVGLRRYAMSAPLFGSCVLILLTYVIDTIDAFAGRPERRSAPAGDI